MGAGCWRAGAKGGGHASTGLGMIRIGGVEAGESGLRVRAGGAGRWKGKDNSSRRNVGAGVRGCDRPEVKLEYSTMS